MSFAKWFVENVQALEREALLKKIDLLHDEIHEHKKYVKLCKNCFVFLKHTTPPKGKLKNRGWYNDYPKGMCSNCINKYIDMDTCKECKGRIIYGGCDCEEKYHVPGDDACPSKTCSCITDEKFDEHIRKMKDHFN